MSNNELENFIRLYFFEQKTKKTGHPSFLMGVPAFYQLSPAFWHFVDVPEPPVLVNYKRDR
ncbi:MAG: hypothetical protein ABW168_10840 [Sedimenticola sp.]